jgi:hypothetical protein
MKVKLTQPNEGNSKFEQFGYKSGDILEASYYKHDDIIGVLCEGKVFFKGEYEVIEE